MSITIEATYEDGVLKPADPLPFGEHQKVLVTVSAEPLSLVDAYGLLGWKGDAKTVERFALDPDFDVLEDS